MIPEYKVGETIKYGKKSYRIVEIFEENLHLRPIIEEKSTKVIRIQAKEVENYYERLSEEITKEYLTGQLKDIPLCIVKKALVYKNPECCPSFQEILDKGLLVLFSFNTVFWREVLEGCNYTKFFHTFPSLAPEIPYPKEILELVQKYTKECCGFFDKYYWYYNLYSGFSWTSSVEGVDFWKKVITDKDFDVFYEKYPKDSCLKNETLTESNNQILNLKINENNEIKLQKRKGITNRGIIPEGSIICGKKGKIAVRSEHISYTRSLGH